MGGFFTTIYYGTWYAYLFLVGPFNELTLAKELRDIFKSKKCEVDWNDLKHSEAVTDVMKTTIFRVRYFCYKRVCMLDCCRKWFVETRYSDFGAYVDDLDVLTKKFNHILSLKHLADNYINDVKAS